MKVYHDDQTDRQAVPSVLIFCYAVEKYFPLKADRPHSRDYPQTPTDYRHTDNHLRLVMVVKRFRHESADGQTDTDGRMLPSALSPCFAVDNKSNTISSFKISSLEIKSLNPLAVKILM